MSEKRHMVLDIEGFLLNHNRVSDYEKLFCDDNGAFMDGRRAKLELLERLRRGDKYLPFGDCEGFSTQTGCPGHPIVTGAQS